MPVTIYLRDGGQVQAEAVQRDGKAVRALVVEHRTTVSEDLREAFPVPTGLEWRTWAARDIKAIRDRGR